MTETTVSRSVEIKATTPLRRAATPMPQCPTIVTVFEHVYESYWGEGTTVFTAP
jgi:hypothetical protein